MYERLLFPLTRMVLRSERSSLHVRYDLDEGSAYTRHVARIENICVHSPDHNKMEKIVEHNKLKQILQMQLSTKLV